MAFINDDITFDIDQLGCTDLADSTIHLIRKCTPPYSIGISGRWGSGKSSMMKYIMARLGGDPLQFRITNQDKKIVDRNEAVNYEKILNENDNKTKETKEANAHLECIWFNPWEHEKLNEPVIELLKEIRTHFSLKDTLSENTRKFSSVACRAGLDMLGSIMKLGKVASNIETVGEKYEDDNFMTTAHSQRFRLVFEAAVEKLLTKIDGGDGNKLSCNENARLIIFIDDLDRCEEHTIAKLLKEIKQYLFTPRCVFVFGYDRHHIERSLSNSIQRTQKETRSYLEKLFQTTLYLPQPKQEKIVDYIDKQLGNAASFYPFLKLSGDDQKKLAQFLGLILDPNPRRIKTFLIAFVLHAANTSCIKEKKNSTTTTIPVDDFKKLVLMTYLKTHYESVFSLLENNPKMLTDLIIILQGDGKQTFQNYCQFFFYQELLSYIRVPEDDMEEEALKKLKNMNHDEVQTTMDRIYEMQGKHSNFARFGEEFVRQFEPEQHIIKYM